MSFLNLIKNSNPNIDNKSNLHNDFDNNREKSGYLFSTTNGIIEPTVRYIMIYIKKICLKKIIALNIYIKVQKIQKLMLFHLAFLTKKKRV